MTKLVWGATGFRNFETGVDKGVLYPPNAASGVPWNGLTSVKEAPSGGAPQPYYHDGIKYLQVASAEEFDATIAAFSAPAEFGICDGTASIYVGLFITQQPRKQFGFAYRTLIGNDVDAQDHGYKIHIVYNALAKPSGRDHLSLSDVTEPLALSWDITTVPPVSTGFKPSAHIMISSLTASSVHLAAVENILYGTDDTNPRLPTFSELITIFSSNVIYSLTETPGDAGIYIINDASLSEYLTDEGIYSIDKPGLDEDLSDVGTYIIGVTT